MKTRAVYLIKEEAFTAAQTKVFPVNVVDPITSIDVIVQMTNGNAMTEASVVKIHNEFTNIKLYDGSDVLVSASMKELQALNVIENGKVPWMNMTLDDSAVQHEACHINFGFDPRDNNHYLRPSDFRNLQMSITNTFTTAAATSWAAAGHNITVIAHVIEQGAGEYQGFLSAKNMYSYTEVSGAVETIDMPRDYQYRLIMLTALLTSYTPYEGVTALKLTCDADKYVPVDLDVDHLIAMNIADIGRLAIKYIKRMTNDSDICYGDLYYLTNGIVGGGTALYVTQLVSIDADQMVCGTYDQT